MKVRDVVCGMEIEAESAAASAEYEGRTYYFCSEGCRAAFEKEPQKYAGAGGGQHDMAGHHHHG